MRKIRPLPGQVLIEILDPPTKSDGGVDLPDDRPLSPEFVQSTHINPEKPKGLVAVVRSIGDWPTLKNGMLLLPEYGVNARVIVNPNVGQSLRWESGKKLKIVNQSQILAILTNQ